MDGLIVEAFDNCHNKRQMVKVGKDGKTVACITNRGPRGYSKKKKAGQKLECNEDNVIKTKLSYQVKW